MIQNFHMQYGKTNWGDQHKLNIIRTSFLLNVSKADLFLLFVNICYVATLDKGIISSLVKFSLFLHHVAKSIASKYGIIHTLCSLSVYRQNQCHYFSSCFTCIITERYVLKIVLLLTHVVLKETCCTPGISKLHIWPAYKLS